MTLKLPLTVFLDETDKKRPVFTQCPLEFDW
jgi:hypothetical protein